jgi:hypothetical protein
MMYGIAVGHATDGVEVCFTDIEREVTLAVNPIDEDPARGRLPMQAAVPVTHPPIYNSKPGSANALYLDFNGLLLTGTVWNASTGGESAGSYEATNSCIPFDMDGDRTTFNDAEQLVIQRIWKRVAEAYSPWDINVTTVEPVSGLWSTLLFTSGKDANGVNNPYYPGALGVAQTLSFGFRTKQPAFCYYNVAHSVANEQVMAHIAKHELGHTFGLKHDAGQGQAVNAYYPGHAGTSPLTSWVPIMGECVQSSKSVVQFSKGDYTGYVGNPAQGQMDDLLKVDLSVLRRPDDHSNTVAAATALTASQDGTLTSSGIITDTADVDAVRFTNAYAGSAMFSVLPLTDPIITGCATLDVRIDLYRASDHALWATANPQGHTAATIASVDLEAGVEYVLMVQGDSEGDPFATSPVGYTRYGSLGQWFMTGILPTPSVRITTVNPAIGPTVGNQLVALSGANFDSGTTVTFDGEPATSISISSSTTLTCRTPAHSAGVVSVVGSNTDATVSTLANSYTYILPTPAITLISPNTGSTAGGLSVTITGSNFASGATLTVGGVAVIPASVSATTLVFMTPAHNNGAVDVVVINPDAQSATALSGFLFTGGNSSTYQQGVGGYGGTVDVSLDNNIAAWNNHNGASNVTNGNRACNSDAVGPSKVYLLKFTSLGLSGVQVTSATLDLTVENWAGAPVLTGTYLSRGWNPAGANSPNYGFGWSNCAIGQAWGSLGAAGSGADYLTGLSFSIAGINSSGPQAKSIALDPAVVQSWLDAPSSNQGVRLVQSALSFSSSIYGSDNATINLRPKLTIHFTLPDPVPAITGIAPTNGTAEGGTIVTITGTNFVNGSVVNIGDTDLATIFVDSTSLTGITPDHSPGPVTVMVTNPGAQSATRVNGYTYTAVVLPVPTGLTARAANAMVNLVWTPSFGASGYTVERSLTDGGPYAALGETSGTNFTDSSVTNGTRYYYVVSATNRLGASPPSEEVAALPLLPLTTPVFSGESLMRSADESTIRFATVAGYQYRVVFTDSLPTPSNAWVPVVPPEPDGWSNASGPLMNIIDATAITATHRFYRIEVTNPAP